MGRRNFIFVSYFLLVFLGAFLGSSVIGAFVKMIPQFVTDGLNAASGMLPALGIAILMQLLLIRKMWHFSLLDGR